jgi:hypothetical protein
MGTDVWTLARRMYRFRCCASFMSRALPRGPIRLRMKLRPAGASNARGISESIADHTGGVSATLSRREPPAGAVGRRQESRRRAAPLAKIEIVLTRIYRTFDTTLRCGTKHI